MATVPSLVEHGVDVKMHHRQKAEALRIAHGAKSGMTQEAPLDQQP
jgi:hypothetical protein